MTTAPKTAVATDLPSLGSSDEPMTVWLPEANMAPMVLRIMMAKMEMTTLVVWQSVCDHWRSCSCICSKDPFARIACDIPCPCVEGGNDGLHDCWLCCVIGRWDGIARFGAGGKVIVGGSIVWCRCDRGIAEEDRAARVVLGGCSLVVSMRCEAWTIA